MNKLNAALAKLDLPKTLALGAVIAAAYYFWVYNDGSLIEANIKRVITDTTSEEAKKKNTEKVLAEASQFKTEIGSLGEKFKAASAKLPTEFKSQLLIDLINATAKDAGVKVVILQPGDPVKKLNYDEIPVKVRLRGSFSNIVMFLYFMGTLERITHVKNFSFINDQAEVKTGLLNFEANVVSFRFRTPEVEGDGSSTNNGNNSVKSSQTTRGGK